MAQQDAAKKCPPAKEQGESKVSLPTVPHGWQTGCGQEQRQGQAGAPTAPQGRLPPLLGQRGQAGLWAPVPPLPLSQPSGDTSGFGDNRAGTFPEPCTGAHTTRLLSLRAEADANSSSSLCGQPRPAQARRRSWRQRAQASARQPRKPIRLNRVPLLRAETGSPGTASRGLPGLSQAVVPVSSSSGGGSFPCQKQSLKGRHAEGAAEPHTSKSLVAKCRRAEDVPDLGTETGTPSTASRGLPGLSPGVVLVGSSGGGGSSSGGFPCQRQCLKPRYPEGAAEPQAPESPAAKRRRIQDVPAQSAETGNSSSARRGVLRLAQDTQARSRQAAPLWLFPGSRTDNRSQPGPIPMRHVWRQQRQAKSPTVGLKT
ncbi:hypothetical protein DUI87_08609 [Hirundo rustica rustica]|uniref:Uncharacterized protein n=1 Tax=Hirundo rustica rustica TaxID=333673 RepID=A0A3M0KKC2_HIRRU|nr:hypothetical protein DUI87_08609 [Hirundo rustica rustica]